MPSSKRKSRPPYSITSSAVASNVGETVRPSALAVLRLMTNSNLADNTTGRSPAFSPLRIRPCPCRKLDPDVMMVQAAEDRQRQNAADRLDRPLSGHSPKLDVSGCRCVVLVRAQHMPQMPLAKHDHMVEALASDGADQSFSVTVLPRRSWRCRSVANAHRANAARKCLALEGRDHERGNPAPAPTRRPR